MGTCLRLTSLVVLVLVSVCRVNVCVSLTVVSRSGQIQEKIAGVNEMRSTSVAQGFLGFGGVDLPIMLAANMPKVQERPTHISLKTRDDRS